MSTRVVCDCGYVSTPMTQPSRIAERVRNHEASHERYGDRRPHHRIADVLEDWDFLGRPHVTVAAARMGTTPAALERALFRAKAKGLLPPDVVIGSGRTR